jgi:hypothetical protein
MTEDPKAAIAAALARPDLAAPLGVLEHAATWAAQALATGAGHDDVEALECVIALDDALPRLTELFRLVPALVRTASAGARVDERMAAYQAELGHQRAALAQERQALEAMRDLERQLSQAESEREQLRGAIEALEHRRLLVQELPVLRARQAELEAIMACAADGDGDQVLRRLSEALHRLRELSQAQRALLETRNAQLLTDIAVAGEVVERERTRRDVLLAELAATQAEAGQLQHEHQQNLPALDAHRKADQDLATALAAAGLVTGESALERLQAELRSIADGLAAVDQSLKPLLGEQATRYAQARQVRTWTGS